jgi:hypothetical protein
MESPPNYATTAVDTSKNTDTVTSFSSSQETKMEWQTTPPAYNISPTANSLPTLNGHIRKGKHGSYFT